MDRLLVGAFFTNAALFLEVEQGKRAFDDYDAWKNDSTTRIICEMNVFMFYSLYVYKSTNGLL